MEDKKKIDLTNGMYCSDRCQLCHEFGEKAEPYVCPACMEKMKALGYTRQPEPPVDKVEAMAIIISKWQYSKTPMEVSCEILKLFPEYEPVELEALGDEEIREFAIKVKSVYYTGGMGYEERLFGLGRLITQATIQKNQAKGRLFRLKEG